METTKTVGTVERERERELCFNCENNTEQVHKEATCKKYAYNNAGKMKNKKEERVGKKLEVTS